MDLQQALSILNNSLTKIQVPLSDGPALTYAYQAALQALLDEMNKRQERINDLEKQIKELTDGNHND